jgi:DNA-binding MltR family transcriptional regulator
VFPPYICTLFATLYLEAFIYDYCARKDSQSLAKSLDKLDPPNKWVIGTKLINGIGIDTGKKSYQDLKNLFQLRNKLAHSRTKNINIENNDNENIEKNNYLEPRECIKIIKEILKELSIIDKDDFYINVTIHRLEGKISY